MYPRLLYLNRVSAATITSSAEDTGYPDDNVINWRDYVRWHASGANSYWIKANYGSQIAVTGFGISGHNLNTCGARIKLEGSNNDADWTVIVAYITPSNDYTLARCFDSVTYQYYKITIDNNGGSNFSPQLGIWFVGSYLEFPELIEQPFDPNRQRDNSSMQRGESGNILGIVNDWTERRLDVEFNFLTATWVETYWIPFWNTYRFQPFFFSWDYTNHQSEIYLLAFDMDEMSVPYDRIWRMPLSLRMTGRKEE